MRTSWLRVTLREVTLAVVRVIDVPAASTLPELHQMLRRVGLLRLANGVLRPTRAASDDPQTDVQSLLHHLRAQLEALDLIEKEHWPVWRADTSARSLSPRATFLAQWWSGTVT